MNKCRICGKEIGKTYSDKKLRCSSCRKSVENAIGYNERTVEYVEDELFAWKSEYKKLEKENKKLKEEKEIRALNDRDNLIQIDKLKKENKKLRERVDILYEFIERNDKLVDEVIDEEDLDKLNRYIYIDDDLVDRTLESED